MIALVHAALQEDDAALDWLQVAIDECDGWRVFAAVDPRLRLLASDARFRRLLQQIGPSGSVPKQRAASNARHRAGQPLTGSKGRRPVES